MHINAAAKRLPINGGGRRLRAAGVPPALGGCWQGRAPAALFNAAAAAPPHVLLRFMLRRLRRSCLRLRPQRRLQRRVLMHPLCGHLGRRRPGLRLLLGLLLPAAPSLRRLLNLFLAVRGRLCSVCPARRARRARPQRHTRLQVPPLTDVVPVGSDSLLGPDTRYTCHANPAAVRQGIGGRPGGRGCGGAAWSKACCGPSSCCLGRSRLDGCRARLPWDRLRC